MIGNRNISVNGYQIDLNQAARQEIFRLPNGKLIQVRKQPNSTPSTPTVRPGLHFAMQPRAHIPVRPTPPTITTTSRMMRPMAPQLRVARPQAPQQRPSAPNQTNASGTVASTVFTQQNGSISVARAPQPDTQLGKAKTAFEDKIINGLEICQHTINKMITLTNSSSFKNSRSFADLKDLYIHLQYLFTYTSGKIKTLQDSLGTNVEELAKHDKSLKEKEKHDSDELEIVEQKQDVIEVLSDDDEEPPRTNQVATKKTAAPFKTPEQQALDIEQEILSALVETMQNTFARQPDQPELLASVGFESNDKKLLTKSAVKVERLEESKSPLVKQYMIAIQQRRDREPSLEQNANNEDGEDGDYDFPPLVPEIVMDENPNPEENSEQNESENKEGGDAEAEPEANTEEKMDTDDAPKSANESEDVVEIPSDDDEAEVTQTNENEAVESTNDQSKEEESQDAEEEQSKNDEEAPGTSEDAPDQTMEVDNNESTEDNPDESVISLDSSVTCNEAIENETAENGTAEENVNAEEVTENGNNENITENGEEADTTQAEEVDESTVSKDAESNEEITKITENGIDEKDLLDNLINSLDENEPLAPIELENFP